MIRSGDCSPMNSDREIACSATAPGRRRAGAFLSVPGLSVCIVVLAVVLSSAAGLQAGRRHVRGLSRIERFRGLYRVDEADRGRQVYWSDSMTVKIGIMENQKELSFTCPAPFVVSGQGKSFQAPAGAKWKFRLVEAVAAERLFWPVVETVEKTREAELDAVVARWQELGHEVTVHEAGARLYFRDFLIHDNRRHYVSVEPCRTETEAEACFQELASHGCKPWVFETIAVPARGVFALFDENGRELARFEEPARVSAGEPIKVFRVEYGVGYPWHGYQDRRFRGDLVVQVDKFGGLVLVDELDIEMYLRGVVPSEMSAGYPLEALCAQAVAARGETLSKYGTRHLADPYDLCASQHCQVYSGLAKEHDRTNQAVEKTKGRILRQGERIADTVYAACCGGHTENNDFVWSTAPSPALRGVADLAPGSEPFPDPMNEVSLARWFTSRPKAWCNLPVSYYQKRFRWTVKIGRSKLDELVRAKYPGLGRIVRLEPLSRGVSGRLRELRVVGTGGSVVVQKELPIRRLFGGLNSAAFVVRLQGDEWVFRGAGWGHGVGMCQWGARGMAEAGLGYRRILSHYFSNTHILDVYRLPKQTEAR